MIHKKRVGFLYPALFLSILLIGTPCLADFRFAVISDTQAYDDDGINNDVLKAIMEDIKSEGVDFILVAGDMITGSTRSSKHKKQLEAWKAFMDDYKIALYCVPSNHLIQSELSEDIFRSIFEMPENGPGGFKELVYSFNYQNAHFVGIDTEEYGNFHRVGEAQMDWLKGDLGDNRGKIIFVFGHDPAYPVECHKGDSLDKYPSQRDHLWSIFKEYGVSIYFCGHEHLYNTSVHDNVYQIITGGAGADLCGTSDNGGFYHFVVVDVKDDGACKVTVKDIDGNIRDSFQVRD